MSLIKVNSIIHPTGTANNITLDNAGKIYLANTALGTANAGLLEYSTQSLYFTPTGLQRGVIPGQQMFILNTNFVGQNINTVQPVFNVGVTLAANTTYAFDAFYAAFKTAGTTAHSVGLGFGGTATVNSILYYGVGDNTAGSLPLQSYSSLTHAVSNSVANALYVPSTAQASVVWYTRLTGIININAAGTFIPQYTLSAAPGSAYTTAAGSYFLIYPVATGTANVAIGTWA